MGELCCHSRHSLSPILTCTRVGCRVLEIVIDDFCLVLVSVRVCVGDGTKTGKSGTIYKPTSKIMQKIEEEKSKEEGKSFLSTTSSVHSKPLVYTFNS